MIRDLETELTMDRPANSLSVSQQAGSGIKTILFDVHDDGAVFDRLQLVLSLARACGAHIHCLHVTPIQAYTISDTFGGTFVNQDLIAAFQKDAADLRKAIETRLASEDVTWDYEEITGEIVPHIVQAAALSDLFITGRGARDRGFGGPSISLIGDVVEKARTPILVTGEDLDSFDTFGPAVIAWNGSCEAADAVRAAVPLLQLASEVRVVEFDEQRSRRFPSTRVLEYLSRQGIPAQFEAHTTSRGVDEALVRYAIRQGANMIVMGGYSHSRAGEYLFGGVTRSLLNRCPIALFVTR